MQVIVEHQPQGRACTPGAQASLSPLNYRVPSMDSKYAADIEEAMKLSECGFTVLYPPWFSVHVGCHRFDTFVGIPCCWMSLGSFQVCAPLVLPLSCPKMAHSLAACGWHPSLFNQNVPQSMQPCRAG